MLPLVGPLLCFLEHPHLVAAVGQFEGSVVPGCVVWLVHILHAVPLQALQKLQKLFPPHIVIGKAAIRPDVCSELFSVLHEHIGVAGLRWVSLKLIWDVEGHGELGFAGGAGSRDHTARDRRGHLHFGLVFVVALNVVEEPAEAGLYTFVGLHPVQSGAHPLSRMIGADLIVLTLRLLCCEFRILQTGGE